MGRDDIADQPRAHRLAHPRLVRRPAAVLVDGELHALVLGQLHEVLAHTEIGDEGFLAQHVLARLQRRLDDRRAMLGVERHVDHVDLGIGQHVLPVVLDPRGGAVFGGLRLGLGRVRFQSAATSHPAVR
jgi:hypothetical protein